MQASFVDMQSELRKFMAEAQKTSSSSSGIRVYLLALISRFRKQAGCLQRIAVFFAALYCKPTSSPYRCQHPSSPS